MTATTGQRSAQPAAGAGQRINEVDLIRGFMLIGMALDHGTSLTRAMGRHAISPITIAQVLPSTTAELFFLLSGYLYGHTRVAKASTFDRSLLTDAYSRAWQLYAYNTVTMIAVMAILSPAWLMLIDASRFAEIVQNPLAGMREFMLLLKAPFGFDVLQLYIIFFIGLPVFAYVLLWRPAVAVAWIVGCWLATQIWFQTVGLAHDETIAINMWAWQITFYGGVALGARRLYLPIREAIMTRPSIVIAACVFLAVISTIWIGEKYPHRMGLDEAPWHTPGVDRASLGPLKILSSLSVLILLIWLSNRYQIAATRAGGLLTMLGQRSLACFCASNFGLYWVGYVWQETGSNAAFWLAEAAFVLFIVCWVKFVTVITPSGKPKAPQASSAPGDRSEAAPQLRSLELAAPSRTE